jgi:NAD(P)-dependent dehydrogenase (short-subunit alcohol dehydrogenase family)
MLSDNVVIVAGGGHGLGKQTALNLADQGATVVINDLGTDAHGEGSEAEPARQTAAAIRDDGGRAIAHFGDISSMDYTEELIADTVDEYGRIDGGVNFAGILEDQFVHKMTAEQWDKVIQVHLRGHFALLRNLAAHWRGEADDGELDPQRSFVSISSDEVLGNIGHVNYTAAKAGILGLTRGAARELHQYNIRVNAVMPRAFTRLIETFPAHMRPSEDDLPDPSDIAPLFSYLMSDHAEDITGMTLLATGDRVGIVSDPSLNRVGFTEENWTTDRLRENFRDTIAQDIDLTNTDISMGPQW